MSTMFQCCQIVFKFSLPFATCFVFLTQSVHSCSRDRYIIHFYCLAVEVSFYSGVVECLPVDPAAQV